MITFINDESFIPDLSKNIHYISWTPYSEESITKYSRLAWTDMIVRMYIPPSLDTTQFYQTIDHSDETGTFYPVAKITIMPSCRQPYPDVTIYKHFNDAMKAQYEIIKAGKMIFDMRDYAYLNPHKKNRVDDAEYLDMILYNTTRLNSYSENPAKVYVILPRERLVSRYHMCHMDFRDASKAEVDGLRIE